MEFQSRSLIDRPFWRVWNANGSEGRGIIGILEANFIAPAHDKQGFERTIGLSRLVARLVHFQKTYWRKNCDKIGYAPRIRSNQPASPIKSSMGNVISDTKGHTGNLSNINIGSYKRFIDTSTSPECPSADGIRRGDNGMEQAQETFTKGYFVDKPPVVAEDERKLTTLYDNIAEHIRKGLTVEVAQPLSSLGMAFPDLYIGKAAMSLSDSFGYPSLHID
ncbi:hypothetical protein Droror1_Dr00012117, partial [Drosera rotundifolia]